MADFLAGIYYGFHRKRGSMFWFFIENILKVLGLPDSPCIQSSCSSFLISSSSWSSSCSWSLQSISMKTNLRTYLKPLRSLDSADNAPHLGGKLLLICTRPTLLWETGKVKLIDWHQRQGIPNFLWSKRKVNFSLFTPGWPSSYKDNATIIKLNHCQKVSSQQFHVSSL